ncbi:MAG: hypothetical protein LVQ63_04895 [Thermoplasmatales archaeon]|nr:hypothetical protein [Thermoplasmatales archaeon]
MDDFLLVLEERCVGLLLSVVALQDNYSITEAIICVIISVSVILSSTNFSRGGIGFLKDHDSDSGH